MRTYERNLSQKLTRIYSCCWKFLARFYEQRRTFDKSFQLSFQRKKIVLVKLKRQFVLNTFQLLFCLRIKIYGKLSAESFTVLLPFGERFWGTVKCPLYGGLPLEISKIFNSNIFKQTSDGSGNIGPIGRHQKAKRLLVRDWAKAVSNEYLLLCFFFIIKSEGYLGIYEIFFS